MRSRFRLYLFDATNGVEVTDHPAHGSEWTMTGRMATDAAGAFRPGTCNEVEGWRGNVQYRITAADFPGRRIIIKQWHPDAGTIERRELAADIPTTEED